MPKNSLATQILIIIMSNLLFDFLSPNNRHPSCPCFRSGKIKDTAINSCKKKVIRSLTFFLTIILLYLSFADYCYSQVVDRDDITNISNQLDKLEEQVESIDRDLNLLSKQHALVTSELTNLKRELAEEDTKPKSLIDRIASIFSYGKRRKREKLSTESQDLFNRMQYLQERRETIVNQIISLADNLIEKSTSLISNLMEKVRLANQNSNFTARDEAWKQVSELWLLTEEATEMRNKYASETLAQERNITLPSLLSNDPEELRLGAAIWESESRLAQENAIRLDQEIDKLERKKRVLEQGLKAWEEMQRRDEERGAVGTGFATTNVPWGSEAATRQQIEDIDNQIAELSEKKQEYENNAERFENQSKALELQASRIEAKLKGKQ
ncbi:hypothetical protein GF312_00080 [Candidatus Poribacteria bacterium]|nr:hypothetical protein [Candidatus Poribacteria bacterium]